jgi:hypothetical protein
VPSFEAASLPLTTGTPTEATSEDDESSRAIARVAANVESSVKVDEANYLAELPRDGLPAPFSIASEPVRATDRAFAVPRLVAVFGSALVFASLMAGFLATTRGRKGRSIAVHDGIQRTADGDLERGSRIAEASRGQIRRRGASDWF